MIVETRAGWTNTRTGEVVRPPRQSWDTRKMTRRRKHDQLLRDITAALAIYSVGSTALIIGLLS